MVARALYVVITFWVVGRVLPCGWQHVLGGSS